MKSVIKHGQEQIAVDDVRDDGACQLIGTHAAPSRFRSEFIDHVQSHLDRHADGVAVAWLIHHARDAPPDS